MAYIALYRKYRARNFEEVLGQKHVTQTLQNALKSGRFSHAYLFTGPRGCGKTSTARLLAKSLNCLKNGPGPEPCDECAMCVSIREGAAPDIREMDAASETGIDDVKETIIENAKYPPMEARYKVFIIDEVHDLSAKAFDALLKTIEEPPPHVVFVLATTELQKVPATIRSRCQAYQFHRGSIADLVERLEFVVNAEGLKAEPAALAAIARMGDGSWRDSLTLLEQVVAFGSEKITLETVNNALGLVEEDTLNQMLEGLASGDAASVLQGIEEEIHRGREARSILESLISKLRELVFASHNVEAGEWLDPHRRGALHEQAVRIGRTRLQKWWSELSEAAGQLRNVGSPRNYLELTLLDLLAEEALQPIGAVAVVQQPVTAQQVAQTTAQTATVAPQMTEPEAPAPTETKSRFPKPPPVVKKKPLEESLDEETPLKPAANGATKQESAPIPSLLDMGDEPSDDGLSEIDTDTLPLPLDTPPIEPKAAQPTIQEPETTADESDEFEELNFEDDEPETLPVLSASEQAKYEQIWEKVVASIREKYPGAVHMLAGAKIIELSNKVAVIGFPTELAFHKMQVENPQNKMRVKAVEDTLSSVMDEKGWKIRPELRTDLAKQEEETSDNHDAVAVALPAEGEDLVELVTDIFDGHVVTDEK